MRVNLGKGRVNPLQLAPSHLLLNKKLVLQLDSGGVSLPLRYLSTHLLCFHLSLRVHEGKFAVDEHGLLRHPRRVPEIWRGELASEIISIALLLTDVQLLLAEEFSFALFLAHFNNVCARLLSINHLLWRPRVGHDILHRAIFDQRTTESRVVTYKRRLCRWVALLVLFPLLSHVYIIQLYQRIRILVESCRIVSGAFLRFVFVAVVGGFGSQQLLLLCVREVFH